jgi:hypothetical protein
MQTNDMEFELTPGMLDTPSLMTPNIVLNPPPFKLTHTINPSHNENTLISNPSSITTTNSEPSSSTSSADIKVLKIEDELKQSFADPRQPTPSPFQKISNTFTLDDTASSVPNDDGITIEVPSTADVRNIFNSLVFMLMFIYLGGQ